MTRSSIGLSSVFALAVAAAVAVLVFGSEGANAYDFNCQFVWPGPSANNDMVACVQDFYKTNGGLLVPPAIPVILIIILLTCYPLTFCCRCCGACGSTNQRPGADCCCDGNEWDEVDVEIKQALYPRRHVVCVKFSALVIFVFSLVGLVLLPISATKINESWKTMLTSIDKDVIAWAEERKTTLFKEVADNVTNALPEPLNNDTFKPFDEITSKGRSSLKDIDSLMTNYFDIVVKVTYGIAALPPVLLLFPLLFILVNVRKCLPSTMTCCYFPCSLLYGFLAMLFLLFGIVFALVHGEVVLHEKALPGIVGWYVVPQCEKTVDFNSMKNQFFKSVNTASSLACKQLLEICDGNTTAPAVTITSFSPLVVSYSKKQFTCPNLYDKDPDTYCTTPAVVLEILRTSPAKNGSLVCNGSAVPNCTLSQCPEYCNDLVPEAKNGTRLALEKLGIANRVVNALGNLLFYADCDTLIDRVLMPLRSFNVASDAFIYGGCGFLVGMMTLMIGMLPLWKGQKLNFSKPSSEKVAEAKRVTEQRFDTTKAPY